LFIWYSQFFSDIFITSRILHSISCNRSAETHCGRLYSFRLFVC
jgi:hypothetical protein